jgi:hypothetical protein
MILDLNLMHLPASHFLGSRFVLLSHTGSAVFQGGARQ